ncbi:uncharacterized protein N7496_003332 [Penicillium cataractarum]|uniref:Carrier domain-containing protein n=1 Tax=Penicillium cataractarum TaxID=2100454 RepID=A0A9W9VHE7_9EURO|nr:uncharacterized protein N7496_003332 [Penicillium cataractarum]KAJ5380904.1 hypothetical protein N7496_003332 [Penicillium cataractarum]
MAIPTATADATAVPRDSQPNLSGLDRSNEVAFPIAIVGMAVRLPGGVNTTEKFWDMLINKRDGHCKVPKARYAADAFYNATRPGTVKTCHGYFLQEDIGYIDRSFFSMSKTEAAKLDPQQRLLLEVVWECMESGGQTNWRGQSIGCYVGVFGEDWLEMSSKDTQHMDRFHVVSAGDFALSNRVSYEYDLQGPSITYRTACSSSMVALHDACQALYSGECSSAVVAGSNLILTPTMTMSISDNMIVSPDGICKTFDASADGYGRGEAINAIYIKPLAEALRQGDPIRAVIRSTAVNCDGRTPSITTPGSEAQERLIRRAYQKAGIENLSQTGFFECHGTGTIAGDTAETSVVAKVFTDGIHIGAVKPNVGHSEGASGITAIIKSALALEKRTIPPNIHFKNPNPSIPFQDAGLKVPLDPVPWPDSRCERVSVNSFGIGGTNAHVILESFSSMVHDQKEQATGETGPHVLVLSAKNGKSLQNAVEHMKEFTAQVSFPVKDLAYTLGCRREHLGHRAFAIVDPDRNISDFETARDTPSSVTFVFTGQGAQWAGMGKELMSTSPSFLNSIRSLDQQLSSLKNPPSWTLEEELARDHETSKIQQPEFAQPLSTAVQLAVVDLLQEWGVRPTSVIGHSSGEIAAAYASGAMTAGVAMAVSYYRGKAVGDANMKPGGMAAVGLAATTASKYLIGNVALACDNSPQSVTLSGTSSALDEVLEKIQAVDPETFCKRLKVSVAYHSESMKEPGLAYEEMMKPVISHNNNMIPLYSTAREDVILDPTVLDASYWRENLQSTVLFNGAVQRLLREAKLPTLFVEIGPHSTLSSPLRQILRKHDSDQSSKYIPTLVRGQPQLRALLTTAGRLHINGAHIDLAVINETKDASILKDLPAYPWLHEESFLSETRLVREWRNPKEPHHELLGPRSLESTDLEPSWRRVLFAGHVPWLWDHVLGKELIFPCAGYIAMAGEAIRQITGTEDYTIHNLSMKTPLVLKDSEAAELVTSLRPARLTMTTDSSWYEFTISAYQDGTWKKHCTGKARAGSVKQHTHHEHVSYPRMLPSKTWYEAIKRRGMNFGPEFRRLESISANPCSPQAGARVQYNDEGDSKITSIYALHPTIIDQNLQMLGVAMCRGSSRHMTKLCMPVAIESIYIAPGRGTMFIDASCNPTGDSIIGNATMISGNKVVLSMERGMLFAVEEVDETERNDSPIARIDWKPHIDLVSLTDEVLPKMLNNRGLSLLDAVIRSMITTTADKIRSLHPKTTQLEKYQLWVCSQADAIKRTMRSASSLCQEDNLIDITKEIEKDYVELVPLLKLAGKISMLSNDLLEGNVTLEEVGTPEETLLCVYKSLSSTAGCADFFSLLGHSNPMLRVLTIGLGNGFAVTQALCGLTSNNGTPMYSKCTVTGRSEAELRRAKETLSWAPKIQYKSLDIAQGPIEQGFEAEGYDLVIASEAFDADMPMSPSLKNIFTLLAPGGRVFHQGVFSSIPLVGYVMGIFCDLWLQQDLACNKPSITPEQWRNELRENGFEESDMLTLKDTSIYHAGTTIASRPYPLTRPSSKEIAILYLSTVPEWAQTLAKSLEKEGQLVTWVAFGRDPLPATGVVSVVDLEGPLFDNISPERFTQFQHFVSQIKNSHVLWLTQSSQMSCKDSRLGLILGVVRTIRHEVTPEFYTLEIDDFDDASVIATIRVIEHINRQRDCSPLDPDREFALEQGKIHVSRAHWASARQELSTARPAVCDSKFLDIGSYGLLNTLAWSERETRVLQSHEVEIDMKYVGLNFRDMMVALGVVGDRSEFGVEASGVVRRVGSSVTHVTVGDAVVVIGDGLLCTRKIVAAERCFPLSNDISLEDAATVACVYGTVILSLIYIGRLQKGQSVLIHCGCGGVGLAAIQICQMLGAEIFTTVGNDDKVQHLMDTFGIPRNRIFSSRDPSFLHGVMEQTGNRGVDLVLNSLSGELLHLSWRCVAKFGKMVELGKRDLLGYGQLDMDVFAGNRAFIGVDAKQIIDEDIGQFQSIMQECMEFLRQGKIKPIRPLTVFDAAEVSQAFRFMQTGKHMGKIVVKLPDDSSDLHVSPISTFINLPSDASIVIVGGLGGLGRTVATWLVEKGARDLVFLSRSGGKSPGAQSFLEEIRSQGCSVTAVAGDVAKMDDVQRAVTACQRRIAGVIHMPMMLKDQLLSKMTHDDWRSVLASKVQGTWNLHNALFDTRLDFFVCFGSLAGLCGNAGQTNYAAANAFLDAFVQYRSGQGLVASVIDLGLMNDAGFAYENAPKLIQRAKSASMRTVEENELVQALELAICRSGQIALGLGTTKPLSNPGVVPPWTRDARYCLWSNIVSATEPAASSLDGDLKELMESVKSNPHILDDPATIGRISKVLGLEIGSHLANIDDMDEKDINNMVIESLAMIEIRSWYRRHLGLELPLVEISNAQTIGGLGKVTVQALRAKYKEASSTETSAVDTAIAEQEKDLQYLQDATLGQNFHPIADKVAEWYAKSEGHVLLIGATGFVGAFMLSMLVASPEVKTITCLVRAECTTAAMKRLETAFAELRLPMQSWDKVRAVTGDITHEDLRLGKAELVQLSKECSAIFHLGAVVNYTLSYSAHRNTNVLGLVNVLKFANTHRLKPVHYFSGMAAYGPTGFLSGPTYVPENERPVAGSGSLQHHTGYSLSKYVAECIAWDAISNGFPLAIHRAGFVLGHSVTGIGNADDAVNRLMSTCISLGAYPIPPAQRNCFVPVDFVCSAAIHISLSNNNLGQAYNLIHPDQDQNIDLSTTFHMLSQLASTPLRAVEISEWAELMSKAVGHRLSGIAPIIAERLTEGSIWWNNKQDSMVIHGTENLHKALGDRPDLLNCKTMFELMETYFAQWSQISESGILMHDI